MEIKRNEIYSGDVIETLRSLPEGFIHTCVTSPPYWGLRDYGVPGQIGLEPTPEEYVEKMVLVFREVWRVLRDDGTLWLNLGDSYGPGKQLMGIPWRVAFALQNDGWVLRSDIIWSKPNAMPESVKDRPTKAHEYIFLLSKSPRYYYDADAIREPHARLWNEKNGGSFAKPNHEEAQAKKVSGALNHRGSYPMPNPKGRNKRTVWTVATKPFKGAHFAVFPPDLIEPCILAGSPEKACPHCGAPWKRVTVNERGFDEIGWEPTCQCAGNNGSGRGVVLDPFFGSGTTGVVAAKHGRQWIGIELNPDYIEIAKRRLAEGK